MNRPHRSTEARVTPVGTVAVVAFLLAVIQTLVHFAGMRTEGNVASWPHALRMAMPFWLSWAALAPVVAGLARRVPLTRTRAVVSGVAHLGFGCVLGAMRGAAVLAADRLVFTGGFGSAGQFAGHILWQLPTDLIAYGGILAVVAALDLQQRYQQRELESARLSEQLTDARLRALRSQLNPHFLFNALNTVAMQIRGGERTAAVAVVTQLSDLLRTVLEESPSPEVPLRAELAFIGRYLAIEQVRYADRLQVETRVDPDVLSAAVPSLLLQPLVENAIRHGIGGRSASGRLEILAARVADDLVIEVRDDGDGVPGAVADGVGLANTRARLKQLYGDQQRLELETGETGGARVRIAIPFRPCA